MKRVEISSAFDVLIENGTIYKGDGKQPIKANIGIKGDKIIFIGNEKPKAMRYIDAETSL